MRSKWDDAVGRLQLWMAVMLHRTVAGRVARERMQGRRDRAIRAARHRGVTVEELAARLGLTTSWIRQVLAGKKVAEPPAVEEAA